MASAALEKIIKEFFRWAKKQTDIRSVVLVSRPDGPWPDLDFVIFADQPGNYLYPGTWTENFGKVVLTFAGPSAGGVLTSRRAMYAGGIEVNFVFLPLETISELLDGTVTPPLRDILAGGARILFDKDGMIEQLIKKGVKKPFFRTPSAEEFYNRINDFLLHAVWTAKYLNRGELWRAKAACDGYLKDILRTTLEWHTRIRKGKKFDPWLHDQALEEWADPRIVQELAGSFARYEIDDVWRALTNTMDLFRWVAKDIAQALGYSYPDEADKYITAIVLQLQLER